MKVYIETYGCALNKADEALMREALRERGHLLVENVAEADAVVINTCTVRLDTEQRMVARVRELYELTSRGNKKLIIAGCMAKAQPFKLAGIAPGASLISPQNAHRIWEAVEAPGRVFLLEGVRPRNLIGVHVYDGVAPIAAQEGCLSNCSFCITKHARRVLVSHDIDSIRKAVEHAVKLGAAEVELTGMDLGAYGVDIYRRRSLPELIKALKEVSGNYMIRIGMMNPEHLKVFKEELVDAMLENEHVYKFLHVPLQSGSNRLLAIMGRKYTVEEYAEVIRYLKKSIPDISIATDVLVGHPEETEEDFHNTLELLKELEFERVHLAAYSIRPCTYSAGLPQLPTQVKKRRLLEAAKLVEELGLKYHSNYVNRRVKVFVVEKSRGWIGRTHNYIPVVLGERNDLSRGQWTEVLVRKATFFDLRA
ncbi:MAG: tRNA (N(6)-L-threonylcarbamoyladenosine(37)-C(2))-methylthiotransferase [Desulfurococcaceae archaeon]